MRLLCSRGEFLFVFVGEVSSDVKSSYGFHECEIVALWL